MCRKDLIEPSRYPEDLLLAIANADPELQQMLARGDFGGHM
jgi:hypothetical protein